MTKAKIGDKVKVHFKGYLEDGTVFGSTMDEESFEFIIGEKNMLPGFENAVVGMQKGDTKTITLSPEDAYGVHKKNSYLLWKDQVSPKKSFWKLGKAESSHSRWKIHNGYH